MRGRRAADERLTYAGAGVDVAAADALVDALRARVAATARPEVVGELGGFAGLFALAGYREPVLVASSDGVGTKSMVAAATGRFETIGVDLVAMCVDDVVCRGAEPLFLLDYVVLGELDADQVESLVGGVAEGCRRAGCALLGGETAVHPGSMEPGSFDLAGFAVGAVERDMLIGPERVLPGDALIGLASPGLRCNGYSLARKVLLERAGLPLEGPAFEGSNRTLAEELLEPSVIYAPAVLALRRRVELRAAAHVTGGGIPGNLPRALPEGCGAVVHPASWEVPRIFGEIQRLGAIEEPEMEATFNLGIGMVLVVPPADAGAAIEAIGAEGVEAAVVGEVVAGDRGVSFSS